MNKADVLEFGKMQSSPLYFIKQVWGLSPQPVLPSHTLQYQQGLLTKGEEWRAFCSSVRPDWFAPYHNNEHITWQQSLVFHGIEKSLRHELHPRISIVSGHGTGKSTMLSWIILWFLFVHPDSQVPCTAPTASGLFDVLWKEIHKWLSKMPPQMQALYEWQTTHVRMKEHPEIWFARAKTSSKENTEALAGVHADWVAPIVDEASGVDEAIYETMEGSLTSGNILPILVGNGTRSIGYFYDTHHKDKARWQTYSFSSLDSPRVDVRYVQGIKDKYGDDSVQYAIRVLGEFPDEGIMDDKGYVQMFSLSDIHLVPYDFNWTPIGRTVMAMDASGEGQDVTAWAVRDTARAAIVAEEQISSAKGMAVRTITLCDKFHVKPEDFIVDAFGSGHAVSQEIALATADQGKPWRVTPINSGEPSEEDTDRAQYINKRAEAYAKLLKWFRQGGEVMDSERLKDELLSIRFRRTQNGRIQIMSKLEMRRLGLPSPDKADALSYTMLVKEVTQPLYIPRVTKPRENPAF
ncbi:MAG: hypothetical protein KBD16_00650 [Candidatus Pacebacteria bacterium]|nr:hypothetical protein [Candidatus Paceibacterota bacterium]